MVDNLTTRAVLKDKLTGAATDLLTKLDHTVQNLGKNKPTEGQPLNYKVTHKGGALVRSGYETTTSQVHQLAAGETVTIVELVGRRARIIAPVEGWVSTETKEGVQIMRACTVQRKTVQNEAFEHMFEQKFHRLKAQQGAPSSGGFEDPRCRQSPDRSPSPEEAYSDSDRDYRRDRDGNRDRNGRDPPRGAPSNDSGFVPRLSKPGSSQGGPVVLAPPPMPGGGGADAGRSAAPAAATAAASSGSADLLSMDDPPVMTGGPQPAQQATFDPFGGFSAGGGQAAVGFSAAGPSAAAAAPPPAQQQPQSGFAEFDAFQSSHPPQGMAGQGGMAAPQQMNPGMMPAQQPMMGGMPGGGFMNQGMGWSGGQQAPGPMGGAPGAAWGNAGQPQFQGQQGMGGFGMGMQMPQNQMGMAMGSGMQAPMAGGMAQGSPMQMNLGGGFQAGPAQGSANAGFGAFGGGGQAGMQMPGASPVGLGGLPGGAGTAPGNNVDDLMSRAMQGVANLSFEQRMSSQPSPSGQGVPMNMMNARR